MSLLLLHIQHTSKTSGYFQKNGQLPLIPLTIMKKLLLKKYIKIIMPAVGSWLTAMICRNLREAYLLEVGMSQIPTDHGALSTTCHVGLYVDFSSTNFSLGL